ncbi:MAG: hypothetical protein FWC71_10285 [Defluviitaleaceae bacterium]|nr:hypothetical protein [Defluviitaleaceae bacterium]
MNENNNPSDQWPPQDQQQNQPPPQGQQPMPTHTAPAHGTPSYGTPPQGTTPYGAPPTYGMPVYGQDTSVMTTKDWLITYLILLIPCVGWVMPFIWAFGNGNINRRNWARALLIFWAISLFLVTIFWIVVFVIIGAAVDTAADWYWFWW